ncbi:MAG: ABC transporter permease [Brevinematales bacterium]|jgi:ABC-type multidrug transport system permease subunit
MLGKIWAVAFLELRIWTRMPMAAAGALIPPLGMVILLLVLSLSAGKQPVALVACSKGSQAVRMADIIKKDSEAYLLTVTDSSAASNMLAGQEVAAVITIPDDFDTALAKGSASLELKLNNVDIDFSDDIRRSVDRSAAQFDAPAMAPRDGDEGQGEERDPYALLMDSPNPYLINIAEDDMRETNVGFLSYQLIPALALLILSVGLAGSALMRAKERENGTSRYLLLSPVPSWALIAGRLSGGLLASLSALLPAAAVCLLTGVITVPPGHWPSLVLIFITTGLFASGLGNLIGSIIPGTGLAAMTTSTVSAILFFLGGGFTTIAFLPEWLRIISSFVPMRYAIDGLRQSLFYPDLKGIVTDLAVLSLSALSSIIAGMAMFRKSWS